MIFDPPLVSATLVQRYKRFLFDAVLDDGTPITGSCPAERVPPLAGYTTIRREQRYGRNSRIDFLLTEPGRPDAYVEVKNVHFIRNAGLAEFPDTVTKRGAKHLEELGDMVELGHRAVMLYVIQRQDCDRFRLCSDLDPGYAAAIRRAADRGVEAYALRCNVTPSEIVATHLIEMDDICPHAV